MHNMTSQRNTSPKTNSTRKKILLTAGMICLAVSYYALYKTTGLAFPCLWYEITGWFCPGCGLTRMLESLVSGKFYQAFRFNPLVFLLLPFGIGLFGDYLYNRVRGRQPLINRLPEWFWVTLILVALVFGLMRNLGPFKFLAPTVLVV